MEPISDVPLPVIWFLVGKPANHPPQREPPTPRTTWWISHHTHVETLVSSQSLRTHGDWYTLETCQGNTASRQKCGAGGECWVWYVLKTGHWNGSYFITSNPQFVNPEECSRLNFLASALQARSDRKNFHKNCWGLGQRIKCSPVTDHLLRLECVQLAGLRHRPSDCSELREPSCLEPLVPPKRAAKDETDRTAPLKLHRGPPLAALAPVKTQVLPLGRLQCCLGTRREMSSKCQAVGCSNQIGN